MIKYVGILCERGKEVYEDEALNYAIINTFSKPEMYNEFLNKFCWELGAKKEIEDLFIKRDPNVLKEFVEWFFSGNWIEEDEEEEED